MANMTKAQRVRWDNRRNSASDLVDQAIAELESTFEICPDDEPYPGETKQEECERLAAMCLRETIGALRGAKALLANADYHVQHQARLPIQNAENAVALAFQAKCPTCGADPGIACDGELIVCRARAEAGHELWRAKRDAMKKAVMETVR